MSTTFSLFTDAKSVEVIPIAADAAGRTGDWVSMKKCQKAFVVVQVAQGHAATVALSIQQASAAAGTGAKALSAVTPIYSNLDTSVDDTLVSRTAAASYTTDAALKNKMVVFEIDAALHLDHANGFCFISLVTGASNALNLTGAVAYLVGLNYHEDPPPTAVA